MQKDRHCANARIDPSKTLIKGNIFRSPSSICEIVHKLNDLNKAQRLVDLYTIKEEKLIISTMTSYSTEQFPCSARH
jgi:hypothetical protein